ncbi:MAG: PilZ domain-containing protein [Candidatus Nealsonbacteria bacterium]|nr:PilZ domain-containing protein [Candidatus Nealsonbacteria bacterium]
MLDRDHEQLAQSVAERLDCQVELPESWSGFFDQTGWSSSGEGDRRRFPRLKSRTLAVLEYRHTLSSVPRESRRYAVYLKDVSRGGVAFMHHEQLFPAERMRLIMPCDKARELVGQTDWIVEIIRCVRVGARCFEVGVRLVEPEPSTCGK